MRLRSPSAGCRAFELFDDHMGMTFPVILMYPSGSAGRPETLGPYTLSLAMNAPIAAGGFPLINRNFSWDRRFASGLPHLGYWMNIHSAGVHTVRR